MQTQLENTIILTQQCSQQQEKKHHIQQIYLIYL